MFRTTIKQLVARKFRVLSTGVAVIIGVAFMAGTLVLTDTIGRTFDTVFAKADAGVDAYARSKDMVGDGMAGQRNRIDSRLVDAIAKVDGVAAAAPSVQGYAQILDTKGSAVGSTRHGPPSYGGNWITTDQLNPFTLSAGQRPQRPGEVVIDRGTAKTAALSVGDRTSVLTKTGRTSVTIVGIARFGTADSPAGASYALFDIATAEKLVGSPGQIDGVRVAAAHGVSEQRLVARVSRAVPADVEVLTGTKITAEDQSSVAKDLSFFNTFLLIFALVALFVGSFIIYNTFSILVAQRTQETALLRAIGASRRQVLGAVLGEAVAVGAIAAMIGVLAGIGVAIGLKTMLGAMGIDLPAGGLVVSTSTIVISGTTGLLVSVAAALLPARRASKTAPVAAMRAHEGSVDGGRRLVIGLAVGAVGIALMAIGLSGSGIGPVGIGVALVFLGVVMLGPAIAGPVTRLLGTPVAKLRGLPGTLARDNATRNPRRTSATAAALMVGVALVGTMTIFAASAKASVSRTINDAFTGDLVIDSGSADFGGLSPALAHHVAHLPEVDAVTGVRNTTAEVRGHIKQIYGVDPASVGRIFDLGHIHGSLASLRRQQIAVSERVAEQDHLTVGTRIPVRFARTGTQALNVAAVYEKADLAGDYVLGFPAYEANVADQLDAKVFITAAPKVTMADVKAAVTKAARSYPQATVETRDGYNAATSKHIDQMLNLVYALLFLAILIALIGIANTLALSIIERTRELGLLRTVGMSRAQLRSTVRWEAVLVALLGTVVGLAVGTAFGWALVQALRSQGINVFVIPVAPLGTIAALAALAGVLAAILPARKAARLDVLRAIAAT